MNSIKSTYMIDKNIIKPIKNYKNGKSLAINLSTGKIVNRSLKKYPIVSDIEYIDEINSIAKIFNTIYVIDDSIEDLSNITGGVNTVSNSIYINIYTTKCNTVCRSILSTVNPFIPILFANDIKYLLSKYKYSFSINWFMSKFLIENNIQVDYSLIYPEINDIVTLMSTKSISGIQVNKQKFTIRNISYSGYKDTILVSGYSCNNVSIDIDMKDIFIDKTEFIPKIGMQVKCSGVEFPLTITSFSNEKPKSIICSDDKLYTLDRVRYTEPRDYVFSFNGMRVIAMSTCKDNTNVIIRNNSGILLEISGLSNFIYHTVRKINGTIMQYDEVQKFSSIFGNNIFNNIDKFKNRLFRSIK